MTGMWPLRIALSKLRPLDAAAALRISIVAVVFAAFLYGDLLLFARLFRAIAQVEAATPFFALGLLRNLLAMVFLVAFVVLFSSALAAAIGAFFTDLDLDVYHSAPMSKSRIVVTRWFKTLAQSATIVFVFLVPLFVAFARQYHAGSPRFFAATLLSLALLLSIPVSVASLAIVLLVRWFPVARVHQIVATLAIIVLTTAVIAFRMSRPERFFSQISTDDAMRVLKTIELPSMDRYPGTAIAEAMVNGAGGAAVSVPPNIAILALVSFALFALVARSIYFSAFVRARESMAPVALGAAWATPRIDRLLSPLRAPVRALIAKEVRTLARAVAQWSQLFLMVALLFIYLYNVRMLPLGGDARATIVAYANLGMAGFVIAAICLRFAYPSVSAEGKAFWLVQSAPVSYRDFLLVKVLVYSAPLTILSLLLTVFADLLLDADRLVWTFTLIGASLLAVTLVSLGVAMGALSPNFNAENPLQVGLSLGGFAYMAVSMLYVGAMMLLMARPVMGYLFWRLFGVPRGESWLVNVGPVVIAVTASFALAVFPLMAARARLERRQK
jgi:ABC-2 type transport system permease protein